MIQVSLQLLPKEQRKIQWDDFNEGLSQKEFMPAGTPDKTRTREKYNIEINSFDEAISCISD